MPVRPPSLRSISAFEAAARHGNFAKAAEELNLTPGAISHAIKSLETRLDQRLFERRGRGVVLTAAGQTLAARVRLSLGLLGDAFDTSPWRTRNRLVISTLSAIAHKILLPSLQLLKDAAPGISLDIRTSDALADLERDADLAIRFGPGGWSGLQSRRLAAETLVPVAAPGYVRPPISQSALGGYTLIHHAESSWRLWLDPAEPDPTATAAAIHIDDSAMAIDAAADGHGIALARSRLAAGDLGSGRLTRLFEREAAAEYSYWAVWSPSSAKRVLIEAVVEATCALFNGERSSTRQ